MSNNMQSIYNQTEEKRPDVIRLNVGESSYLLVTPNADNDYIQKKLCNDRVPYEYEMLIDMKNRLSAGDLVIDVGANVGNHTIYLAYVVGCNIIAIEPNESLAEAIIESASLNGIAERVRVEKIAAARSGGHGHFACEVRENLGAQRIELGEGGIRVLPLESLLLPKPVKAIKIDVEGMELSVLQGAEALLRNDRPILYVECQTENDFRSIANWLDELDYGYWDTFNATPTHLFMPNEQVDLSRRVSRLQFKEVLGTYRMTKELSVVRSKLDQANQKYREVNERYAQLKERIQKEEVARKMAIDKATLLQTQLDNTLKSVDEKTSELISIKRKLDQANLKYRDVTGIQIPVLKSEIASLRKQLAKIATERSSIEQRLIKTRSSLTYQLGYQIKTAATSVRGFISLPVAFWQIYKQARRKDKDTEHKNTVVKKDKTTHQVPRPVQPQIKNHVAPTLINETAKVQVKALQIQGNRRMIKVACIMDEFTCISFRPECNLKQLTPANWQEELENFQPEILFIESAWRGKDELWGGKVGHKSLELQGIVQWCHEHSIPTVFWNKEDPVHFQTFLNTAKLFDYVFTSDLDCIHHYKAALGHERVYLLPFACQPTVHNPIELYQRKVAVSFAGAYYVRYPERTRDLESFLKSLPEFKPVEIYDRNYGNNDPNYQFPAEYQSYIVGTLPFDKIDLAYKGYQYAINLNSIKQSQSMFARRVFELLGSNTITLSNFSRGMRLMFGDLVITSDNGNQLVQRLRTVAENPVTAGKFKLAALRKVMREHTYQQRLDYILAKISGELVENSLPSIAVLAMAATQTDADGLTEQFLAQTHPDVSLTLVTTGNVQYIEDERVHYLNEEQAASTQINDVVRGAAWVAGMCAEDYYGPNYLLDIALATRYSSADLIGKAAHYAVVDQNILLQHADSAYRPVKNFAARRSVIKKELVAMENLHQWINNLSTSELESAQGLAIDPYNYCSNAGGKALERIKAHVNDLPNLDTGLSIEQYQSLAERIQPASSTMDEAMLGPDKLDELFAGCSSKRIKVTPTDSALVLRSYLGDGKHQYLYAIEDLEPNILTSGQELKCYLDTTPGLAISLVILFLDANKQRINHVIFQANRNATAKIPPETSWLRLGLRVLSGGETEIKGIVLGHRDLQPAVVLSKAEHLLLTNHYPAYHDLYRNGFVHSRVKAYAERGVKVDVFRLRNNEPLNANEFEGVDVLTGDAVALEKMLSSGHYKSVLVHFLSQEMWEVLRHHLDSLKIIVWVHGAEIQPWWRREYNYSTKSELELGKLESERRMGFWRELLQPMPANLKLIFVSRYFAEEVMEDLGFRIPEEQYEIIHNPINTVLFSYREKPIEQRTKILSIRPYASAKYANDLSVKAIQLLAAKPWFRELEFKMVGDGPLFKEILGPLRKYPNVHIEKRFLTQDEIARLHKGYGVFLTPTRMDAQGVSRDEAMSSGLVPVTNAVAAIPEFVDETCGILAPAEDAQHMADGIASLYENPEKFISMSRVAAERVRYQSSVEKIIERELSALQGL